MTIIQPTKPPDITPDKWTSEIWHYILKFLQPLDASLLFYSAINGAETPIESKKHSTPQMSTRSCRCKGISSSPKQVT